MPEWQTPNQLRTILGSNWAAHSAYIFVSCKARWGDYYTSCPIPKKSMTSPHEALVLDMSARAVPISYSSSPSQMHPTQRTMPNSRGYPQTTRTRHQLARSLANDRLTPSVMSSPGTCTFIPQRPVTKFIGLRVNVGP